MVMACCDTSAWLSGSQKESVSMRHTMSMPRCCQEVSEVINRVRAAFGNIPMKAVSDLPEIKAAEKTIERAARLVLSGTEDFDVWQGALIVYEATWMSALRELRRSGKWAA